MANITNKMRYFIATLALLVVSCMAYSQEAFVNFYVNNRGAIVRHIDNRMVLIYDHSIDGNYFFLVNTNNPTNVPYKKLSDDMLKINDFEIFDNVVYFCGITNEATPHALFGYFSIWSYLDGEVYIDTLAELKAFNKLDVFSVDGQTHVVMTAQHVDGASVMVDAYEVTPNTWQYFIAQGTTFTSRSFDDVAVIDDYIVFSQSGFSIIGPGIISGYTTLWFFPKPLLAGPLFYSTSNINTISYDNKRLGLTYIKHKTGNKFDLACNSGYDRITIDQFDATSYNQSFLFTKDTNDNVSDICYDNVTDDPLVLVANIIGSSVYTTQTFLPSWNSYGKHIASRYVQSIDKMPGGSRTLSVGHDAMHNLYFFLIDFAEYYGCAPVFEEKPDNVIWEYDYERKDIILETCSHDFRIIDYSIYEIEPKIKCETNNQ